MRSMATRRQHLATSEILDDAIQFLKSLGFDFVMVETAGIGQSDSEIVDLVDLPVYVMTSDYGAASQLEKIDMLDYAELVVLNKYDQRGSQDALRDVRKQWKRNHHAFDAADNQVPVYPTIASQFNDPGMTWMFSELCRLLREKLSLDTKAWTPDIECENKEPRAGSLIPGNRSRYLAEIAEQGREINTDIANRAEAASRAQHLYEALKTLDDPNLPAPLAAYAVDLAGDTGPDAVGGEKLPGKIIPSRSAIRIFQRWQPPNTVAGVICCVSCRWRICPAVTRTPEVYIPIAASAKTQPACLPAKARRSGPTDVSITWPRVTTRRVCQRPLIR